MSNDVRQELIRLLPRLRRFAFGLAGNREDADDLVQAACERALERLHQWEAGTRLDSWMYRIVQNLWIDRVRGQRFRGDPVDPEALAAVADETAHRLPEIRSNLAGVAVALERLPEEQRVVLMLVCVEDLSYREAAEALGVPIGTVMSRLARARLRLHELTGIGGPGER